MAVDVTAIKRMVERYALQRAQALGDAFVERVKSYAPRRTGALADSVEVTDVSASSSGVRVLVVVGAAYGRFQNDGTGIYGPNGQPIRAKQRGGVLVFDSAIGGGVVFARQVRGTEPTHFWNRAVDDWPRIVQEAA